MPRFFLKVQYHGARYKGWQVQPGERTVQGVLQHCVTALLGCPTSIIAAGRTDAGVHARGMWVHFDAAFPLDLNWVDRLNKFLPPDVSILDLQPVPCRAHSRFDAVSRTYRYYLTVRKDPFSMDGSWIFEHDLNLEWMNSAARKLVGYREYGKVSKKHSDNKTSLCRVIEAFWRRLPGDQIYFSITANRFLRNMVRSLVGLLIRVGTGKLSQDGFDRFFLNGDAPQNSFTAPAQGLYLEEVRYPLGLFNGEYPNSNRQ